ncbi:MAG TPA: glycosyltransferase family 4 protein [Pyrinomonadaceae bacterium]|jgi:glycosyltransferase involved in cell wall biosynthesis|nr:glycosyltransferase family 4 protein [Pyrinomonadaceae bacterium]
MRIAILNWSGRKVGGIETYLSALIPALVNAGHEVGFFCEVDQPVERDQISLPPAVQSWCVSTLGKGPALQALRDWQPDLLYTHKLENPELEAETLTIARAVFFAHDYHGMCISGTKTHQFPRARPCDRKFGAACLLHYFPQRCGGLNPITMMQLYSLQTRRTELLCRYDAVVTHSDYMRGELIKHGVSPERAYSFPFLVEAQRCRTSAGAHVPSSDQNGAHRTGKESQVQLVFSGRMEQLKGGHILLEAMPEVQRALAKKVRVVFAGDGRKRGAWEEQAGRLLRQHGELEIEFVGWLDSARLELLLDQSDLMVAPSLWPEPFGLAGPEAGLCGLPAAAFAVGGIPGWLEDGVNGYLAPGDPPTAKGLAEAIIHCLKSPETHAHLRRGAARLAAQYNMENHLTNLMSVLDRVRRA